MNKFSIFLILMVLLGCGPASVETKSKVVFEYIDEAHKAKCGSHNDLMNYHESNFDNSSVVSEGLLESAIMDNCPNVLERLVVLKVDVNNFKRTNENKLPLDLAINLKHHAVEEVLRRSDAKSFVEMSQCESLSFKFHKEYFSNKDAAEKAITRGCLQLFQTVYSKSESDAVKYLDMSLKSGQVQIAKYILNNGFNKKSRRFGNKLIELSRSAHNQTDVEKAVFLISAGFPLNEKDKAGKSAFHYALKFNNFPVMRALIDGGANIDSDLELLIGKKEQTTKYAVLVSEITENQKYSNRANDILAEKQLAADLKRRKGLDSIKRALPGSIRKGDASKLYEFIKLGGDIDRNFGIRLVALSILHKNNDALAKLINIGVPLDIVSKNFGLDSSYSKTAYDRSVNSLIKGWAHPLSFVNLAIMAKNTAGLTLLLENNAPTSIASTSSVSEFEVTSLSLAKLTKVAPIITLMEVNASDRKQLESLSKLRASIETGNTRAMQDFFDAGGNHQQLLNQRSGQILSIPSAIIDSTISSENKIELIKLLYKNSYTAKYQNFDYLCRAITVRQSELLEKFFDKEAEHSGMCGTENMAMSLIIQKNRAERALNKNEEDVHENKVMYDFLYGKAKNYSNLASAFLLENTNNPDKVNELLEMGANPNSTSFCFGKAKCTPPIWYSIAQGNYKSTSLLLRAGADVSGSYRFPRNLKKDVSKPILVETNKENLTTLHSTRKYTAIQMAAIGDNPEIISMIIEQGGKPEEAIAMAISNFRLKALVRLTDGNGSLKNRMACSNKECDRVIHPNASNNRYETEYHETYLTFAMKQKVKPDLIEVLLKNGVEVDVPEGRGRRERPIELAYRHPDKNVELIRILEKYGAEL